MQPRKKFESAYENLDKYVFFLVSNIFFSDIRGPRYLPLKKVYFFVGHLVQETTVPQIKRWLGSNY